VLVCGDGNAGRAVSVGCVGKTGTNGVDAGSADGSGSVVASGVAGFTGSGGASV
jgi:hypothetical protein